MYDKQFNLGEPMDISSEEEEYFKLTPHTDDFIKAYNEVFPNNNIQSSDEINEEKFFFIKRPKFIEKPEEKTTVISNENQYNFKIQGIYHLFNSWKEKYEYNALYSQNPKFKAIFREFQEKKEENNDSKKYGQGRRRNDPDNIRKKIKTDFRSTITSNLNKILSSENLPNFQNSPQIEISNVAKEENKKIFELTLKEMLIYKGFENTAKKKEKNKAKVKDEEKEEKEKKEMEKYVQCWEHNKKTLEFIENLESKNKSLYQKLNNILNKKMKDLYVEYLNSDEFQKSLKVLKEDGDYFDYIHKYYLVAQNVLDYYNV